MDSLTLYKKNIFLKDLLEAATCPVCLNILDPDVICCQNGHAICYLCKQQLVYDVCPTCRGTFTGNTQPTTLKNILSSFPRYCKYESKGCQLYLIQKDLKQHEYTCHHRAVKCLFRGCSWYCQAEALESHIKDNHPAFECLPHKGTYHSLKFENDTSDIHVAHIRANFCLFWLLCKKDSDKDKFFVFFVCTPLINRDTDFYSLVQFVKKGLNIKFQFTQKVFDENTNVDQIFKMEKCMSVPLSEIRHFVDKTGTLKFEYNIFHKDFIED